MAQKRRQLTPRRRWLLIGIGGLLVICVLGAVAAALIFQNARRDDPDRGSSPSLVDSPSTGRDPVPSSGGEAGISSSDPGASGEPRLHIRLSKGQAQPSPAEAIPLASGEPLSEEEIQAILARLPELEIERGDSVDFRLPEDLLPPPRPGETIEEPFPPPPPPVEPVAVDAGSLEVLRFGPEGEIPLAPFVTVTFNQPMVPLATLEDLATEEVPLDLQPSLPGTWKWIGTKTLSFEHDSTAIDRLPMATEFVATIPAGTESASGNVLAAPVSWTFSTPPPGLIRSFPGAGPQPLEPLFFAEFDQRIDPEAVLATTQVTAGGRPVSVRLAADEEIEADKVVSRMVEDAGEARWLAFRASEPLPAAADVSVTFGPGTPSAEGPLRTTVSQDFAFSTYAPLAIEEHGCSWSRDNCPPLTPFFIRFNNPIDVDAYEESMIRIEPALPGSTVSVFGNTITIRGATEGRKTYSITVDGSIGDIFGQTLGDDETLRFRVGPAEPLLAGPDESLVTLDPAAELPALTVYAINYNRLQVRAYAVGPEHWPAFKTYLRDYYNRETPPEPPGRLVLDETVTLEAAADALTEANIDLSGALDGEYGHLIVIVEPVRGLLSDDRYRNIIQTWVQVTQIGLDAFADHSEMVVWATDLNDGAPLPGVDIEGIPAGISALTGTDGTARFDLPGSGIALLVARLGDDLAILPRSSFPWGEDTWQGWTVQDELRWYVFDDRQMYRPGEEVHVKGWLRRVGGRQDGDVGTPGSLVSEVRFQVIGPQGNEVARGSSEVNALGGFDFTFNLPENVNLGHAQIMLDAVGNLSGLLGANHYHPFQIQEFRRPEFEVTARNETSGPYFVGDHAVVAVAANYFAGGPLPNAEVDWLVTSSPSNYEPPNWPDFIFGEWTPWWFEYEPLYEAESSFRFGPDFGEVEQESFSGLTDGAGEHYLRLDFEEASAPRPFSVLAEGTVIDVNRQAWAAGTTMLVHPADVYVGLRSDSTFVERGDPLEIDFIVSDIDGNAVAGQSVEVKAARSEWRYRQGEWREEEVDAQICSQTSTLEPVTCTFDTEIGGTYQITGIVTDEAGRQNQSEFQRWVSGGDRPAAREVEQEALTLIPDKETYQPGDVARILVQAPFSPGEGLLTASRSGILYTERFQLGEETVTLEVPIEEKHIPNLHLQVDVAGAAPRTGDDGEVIEEAPPRPAFATGRLNLSIPPLQRTLSLEATPRETELAPGEETTLDLTLTDASGRPVAGAELAAVVVDEAILALSNYQLADPLDAFYRLRPSDVDGRYGRASIVLANPEILAAQAGGDDRAALEAMPTQVAGSVVEVTRVVVEAEMAMEEAPMAAPAEGAPSPEAAPIQVRSDFNPLATFAPAVRTDANGQAQVAVKLPDNLTRYRVMVVAVDESNQFGMAESNLVARLPLMVRPSAPRFLNFGDNVELPVVLQNQTGETLTVDVVVEASNVELTGAQGQRVTVPARDRVEVRFPATTVTPGTARLQFAAVSGDFADAATVALPVYTPATTEAFATYGVVDEGAVAQLVAAPTGVFPQFGGLEIDTSSTALQALTDAVLYLFSYPFEGTEQLSSRILAVAALRDVLTAFSAEGLPTPQEMEESVQRDVERLGRLQNGDGGFPYWERSRESIPFHTIHAAHALQRARLKGFEVPQEMQGRVLEYLRDIESHYPHWYGLRTRQTLSAYALYVRDLMGDTDLAKARALLDDAGLEELSLEAVAWLWQVLNDDPASAAQLEAIRRHIGNRAVETAGAANFTTSYGDEAYLLLHSNRRADAVILDALIAGDPDSDLIPKVVNGLLAHRTRGRWSSTQENVFVLLALDRYFQTFEAQTPDFVAQIWLGDTYAGSHAYAGRTTERHETDIPMSYLTEKIGPEDKEQNLILSKEGPGRLYYRLGLRYAPTDLALDPLDMGFVIQRSYEAMDDPEDVYQDEDGVWHVKAGARVRVRLKMVADNRRYHVALVDPLPAGLEIVNPALAVSGSVPQDPNGADYVYGWWWWGPWYEHQNMRDERAEAFAPLLWDGVYDYDYVARATTPGTFVVPPAKAEEMYSPEVFGRSGSDWLIVE